MTRFRQGRGAGVYVLSRNPDSGEARSATAGKLARFRSPNPRTRFLESATAGLTSGRLLVEVGPDGVGGPVRNLPLVAAVALAAPILTAVGGTCFAVGAAWGAVTDLAAVFARLGGGRR